MFTLQFLNYQQTLSGILFSFSPSDVKIPIKKGFSLFFFYQNLLPMVATASEHFLYPVTL